MNDFYVYAWQRPCGTPFYIGKGRGNRAEVRKRNPLFDNIIRKMKREGGEPIVVRLHENLTEEEAFAIERAEIAKHGRRDNGTGILANLTDGGEGSAGVVVSEEARLKRSQSLTGHTVSQETREKLSAIMRTPDMLVRIAGVLHSDEVIAKRLDALRTPEVRAKIGASSRGRKHSEQTRSKMSTAHVGNKYSLGSRRSEEQRQKLSDGLIERWKDASYRERTSSSLKEVWADKEKRASRLEGIVAANQNPARNAKIADSVKALWETEEHRSRVLSCARMTGPRADNTSGFKGVTFDKQTQKWRALIRDDGKATSLGRFEGRDDAARAYDRAAIEAWGLGNCYLNFPEEHAKCVA